VVVDVVLQVFREIPRSRVYLRWRCDKQEFQDWIFLTDGRDELLQTCNRYPKADSTDAIALVESKDCSLFIFCREVAPFRVINDNWKGR